VTSRPAPVLALQRRHRVDGPPYLAVQLTHEIVLPAGAELHLRRPFRWLPTSTKTATSGDGRTVQEPARW
jgi:hypothetical protein